MVLLVMIGKLSDGTRLHGCKVLDWHHGINRGQHQLLLLHHLPLQAQQPLRTKAHLPIHHRLPRVRRAIVPQWLKPRPPEFRDPPALIPRPPRGLILLYPRALTIHHPRALTLRQPIEAPPAMDPPQAVHLHHILQPVHQSARLCLLHIFLPRPRPRRLLPLQQPANARLEVRHPHLHPGASLI